MRLHGLTRSFYFKTIPSSFFQDLPSVISDRHVAFLDPQEVFFGSGETGRKYDLTDPLLHQFRDQFSPYENVLDCQISSGYYNGTLFRLPLRKWPSRISVKSYTASKVKALFESFIEEAPTILLFLKHVESISLYETNWNECEKHVFTVRIKEDLKEAIREMKRNFIHVASRPLSTPYEMCYEVVMEEIMDGKYKKEHEFLVLNRVGSENPRLAELSSHLHQIPWAGVATPLKFDETNNNPGRLFCFLPLPAESECRTGLNVHIHSTFGLTDNRRTLRWPGPECQSDDAAEWNVLLLKYVVSKAYASLILNLTQSQQSGPEIIPVINALWPDLDHMERHWKDMLEPFFKTLINQPVFWTTSQGGKWVTLKEAVWEPLDDYSYRIKQDVKDVVFSTLLKAGEPVVRLPEHAVRLLKSYLGNLKSPIHEITPSYVHTILTKEYKGKAEFGRHLKDPDRDKRNIYDIANTAVANSIWSSLGRRERLCLLEFMLISGKCENLEGLPLLPLADKSFAKFKCTTLQAKPAETVFVASRHHQRNLLPGCAHRFLDEELHENLLQPLRALAVDLNKKEDIDCATQLVKLTPSLVPQLIRESLPEEWMGPEVLVAWNPSHEPPFNDMWLRNLWSWLRVEFPEDLNQFEGIPLIPLTEGKPERKYLIKLRKTSNLIQSTSHFASLPKHVRSALQKAGSTVLHHLPAFCDHHALKHFVEPPTPSGVLKVLASVLEQNGMKTLNDSTAEEKLALRAFLSSMRNPSDDEVVTLMSLPIFTALDGETFTSVRPSGAMSGTKLDVAPPRLGLPSDIMIANSENIISAADDDSFQLLRRLPVRIFSTSDFLIEKVFPYVSKGDFYTREQIANLMSLVLQRLPILSSDKRDFPERLRVLKFVPVSDGSFVAPCDLYDPEDDMLKKLFEGQSNAFPSQEFAKPHALSLLRVFLGLRRSRSLAANDVFIIAKQIDGGSDVASQRRAEALLRFLNENAFLLEKDVLVETSGIISKETLANALKPLRWIPASQSAPNTYPSTMPWFTSTNALYSPIDIRDAEAVDLVGSVMPLRLGTTEERVRKAFGWTLPPSTALVLAQLRVASKAWQENGDESSTLELFKFQATLKEIYDYLSKKDVLAEASLILKDSTFPPWIWNGSGFSRPSCVAFDSTCPLDLKPHVYIISQDFLKYAELFTRCGVKKTFDEGNILEVLHIIRDSHLQQKPGSEVVERDLRISNDILKFLTRDGISLPPEIRDEVLIPTQSADGALQLEPLDEVSFCDAEWLQRNQDDPDMSSLTPLVHESISTQTAQLLGTQALSTRLAVVETLGFEQTGPHEPVTTRLKNIVKDQKDDLAVFKELLQNADDSGATEVKFLIDWRNNPTERLLSPGMVELQGPSLWVYNDAVFTDEDFENINKLAGATKVETKEKIGRFGIGFCSVYNVTDVPSFISREYIVFFDPQTNHLQNFIKDMSRPGIRLNLRTNPRVVAAFSDQFLPYQGVFGCNFRNTPEEFYYDGTLFRLPLRTLKQAAASELSNKYYDEEGFCKLTKAFHENATQLLLFLKNVRNVSFHEIKASVDSRCGPEMLFEIKKITVESVARRSIVHMSDSFVQLGSPQEGDLSKQRALSSKKEPTPSSIVVSLQSKTLPSKWFNADGSYQSNQIWLTTTCFGHACSVDLASTQEGKLEGLVPNAGVAALLSSSGNLTEPWKLQPVQGEVFSGLPLSTGTGLPVHINGCFAVPPNRRGLWEDTSLNEKCQPKPLEVLWNQYLLEDAAASAYVQLLEDIIYLHKKGKVGAFPYELLWPNVDELTSKTWKTFASSVYLGISRTPTALLYSNSRWVSVRDSSFLDEKVAKLLECQMIMEECGYQVVDLPTFVVKGFLKADLIQTILERTVTLDRFLRDVYFPNVDRISPELRDPITCYVMDEYLQGAFHFEDLLRNSCCIPSSPNGNFLVRPRDLVDPGSSLSKLFWPEENRFPFGECFLKPERMVVLRKLGMTESILSWEEVCERATSLAALMGRDRYKGVRGIQSLFKYLDDYLEKLSEPTASQKSILRSIQFLPFLPKPREYCLPWKSTELPKDALLSANELYRDNCTFLVARTQPILDESPESGCGHLSREMLMLLGLANREPKTEDVLMQLHAAVECLLGKGAINKECIRIVCCQVYEHLQNKLKTPEVAKIQEILKGKPWILVGNKFVASNQVSFSWIGYGEPFLYGLPHEYTERFGDLFKALGVNETFTSEDIIEALFAFEERMGRSPLSPIEFRTVKSFLNEISDMDEESLNSCYGLLPVPDSNLVLQPIGELAFNDAPWFLNSGQTSYVHADIPWPLAHKLGAHGIREIKLDRYSQPIGKEFGQIERLTTRLKNILKSYPCDVGILKEILQNADDANATEVHLIYDPRHHGTTKVLSNHWKELQGPALCIYNDRPFTDKDIDGIQQVGIGSKRDNPAMTGKCGVGFNAVYHITDCPSFVTDNDAMCILDPHARYAPGATRDSPGRLLDSLDEAFWYDFADVRSGYLGEFFQLRGSTMFRLPLRTESMAQRSEISTSDFTEADVDHLLAMFENEARDMLIFLRSVRKISISRIEDNKLMMKYEVVAKLTDNGSDKLRALQTQTNKCKPLLTRQIPWFGISYGITLKDTVGREEEWLIHQSLGSQQYDGEYRIPDSNMLPHAGVAACVRVQDPGTRSSSSQFGLPRGVCHRAFCLLPLPVNTGLPVHVNGYFALDNSRRGLWTDEDGKGSMTQWNDFIKTQVLVPAYASLIMSARQHIAGIQEGTTWFVSDKNDAASGLQWYYNLFPELEKVNSDWTDLAASLYRYIAITGQAVLPIIQEQGNNSVREAKRRPHTTQSLQERMTCFWMPPADDEEERHAFFSNLNDPGLERILLKIGLPLLNSPERICGHFKVTGAAVRQVTPEVVMSFLASPRCNVGVLPHSIDDTTFESPEKLAQLVNFCMKSDAFLDRLDGLPILLTEDDVLSHYDSSIPVFLTPYSELITQQKAAFLHRDFVAAFSTFNKNALWKTGLFKRFDTKALEPFLIHMLPSRWFACDTHVPWEPTTGAMPSHEWLVLLWKLIHSTYLDRQSCFEGSEDATETLLPLEDWPIFPTTAGTLVPPSLGKTVLDLGRDGYDEDGLVRVLRKLGCAELDLTVMPGIDKTDISQIASPYLARPHSRQDIVSVLHYLSQANDLSNKLTDAEVITLLRHLQDDVTTVYSHKSLLRSLPFYKTLDGKYESLASYAFVHVTDLPDCLPLKEIQLRIAEEDCVLLQSFREIEPLYKALDISRITQVDVFAKYVLPHFDAMTQSGRREVLEYIKDTLLVTLKSPSERNTLLSALKACEILQDDSGELHTVSKYYDPENAVFKAMLCSHNFPPMEFCHPNWLLFLRDIGLRQQISQQQFIEFAEALAREAEQNWKDPNLTERSKALVEYLLQQGDLHDACFLHIVSRIKFVASERASPELKELHVQFECSTKDDIPPFTEFHGSVSYEQQKLVWTSTPLLPAWAFPSNGGIQTTMENLGIEPLPALDQVIKHLEHLCSAHSGNVNKDTPKYQRELLHDVMCEVFNFFKGECTCPTTGLSDRCTRSCLAIGNILRKTPCIPVEEGRVLVEGNQLAFEKAVDLPPFFYKVPREYGHLEHLLKRLGAEEKPTPLQFSKVLERLKEVCEDKHMEPNEKRVARIATQGFFTTLSLMVKEKSKASTSTYLASLNELFLPSKEGFLKPSHELIFHDCPTFERRARDFAGDFVDISREGELTADRLSYLLGLLPTRLRAKTIQSLLHEEMHPSCGEKHCIVDSEGDACHYISHYRSILLSPKLVNGIVRVIRHQRQTPNLPQEVKDQVQVLTTNLHITCMASLETHLVHLESGQAINNSKEAQDCFLEDRKGIWELFIRHGSDENPLLIQLCFLINRLIGSHIEKEIYLQAMLASRKPDDILPSLDRCGVAQDLIGSKESTKEPVLGSEIPVMYHYLLKQDIAYFFRQGEIVGYEKERRLPDGRIDDTDPLYVYAKVVRKVTNRTGSNDNSKYDFQAKYRIDIGEPRLIEVSVLDLYKFDRSGGEPLPVRVLSDSQEITLFTGDPRAFDKKAATRNERLENTKKEIRETLWEAWKLQEKERRKVIKRLFLRWHPDKNAECDIAHDVMQFLLSEIERLERLFPTGWREQYEAKESSANVGGFSNFQEFFNQWDQRARQERRTYNTFKRQNSQKTAYSKSSTNPQRNEARRWIKQAREDLKAAKQLNAQDSQFHALVCFLCHDVAEKAFKSALYAASGIAENQLETHDVLNLAYEITELDDSPEDIALLAAKLKNYYEKTRYPHFHRGDVVPFEAFTSEHASEALQVAESILEKIGEFLNVNFAKI